MTDNTYNGWANYETWNVALWIGNDEGLYHEACDIARRHPRYPYQEFIAHMEAVGYTRTEDGVKWIDPIIDESEMDEMIMDLVS